MFNFSSKKERIFITGGTGFIGTSLLRLLSKKGAELFVLSRNQQKAKELKSKYPNINIIIGDLKSPDTYVKNLGSIDTIYHFGAKTGIWGNPDEYIEINYYGTKNLIDAAEYSGVKNFVYCSTVNVTYKYGYLIKQSIQDHNTAYLRDREYLDAYSLSKVKAEKYVLSKHRDGFKTVAIRPGWAWGPGDTNILNNVVKTTQGKITIMVELGGQAAISYVDNINHAAILAAKCPYSGGKAFFVTDDYEISNNRFFNDLLIAANLPLPKLYFPFFILYPIAALIEIIYKSLKLYDSIPMIRYDAYVLTHDMLLDIKPAINILGYQPIVSYREGMQRFKKWWDESGYQFFNKKFNNKLQSRF